MQESTPIETDTTVVKQEVTDVVDTKPKKVKSRNYSEWYAHVKKHKDANPGISHTEAVKQAKATYTKTPKVKKDTSNHKPNPWMNHINEWMDQNPDWRKTLSYKQVLRKLKTTYKRV